ncbi:MAG: hypothetical protein JW747_09995, partial [Candidatus Aminicenantes bacterium]|nr:hypothetical protein [Candidatus Aminicenantes bacterium]
MTDSPGVGFRLAEFLSAQKPPCLSLYQPTFRHHPDNRQDPIRFGNLVKRMENSLAQKYSPSETRAFLEPFRALAADRGFWNHTLDGLAVLASPGLFKVFKLQRPVPERAVVADSFHIKPLIRIFQSADRYQILGLSRQDIKLFEGNRDVLDEIEPALGVPRTITEALGKELTEPHLTVASYGLGAGKTPMRHGHGGKKDEVDKDAERFFRAVDRAVLEHHSRPSGLPLLLAALPEHAALFRKVSRNPQLADEGIDIHPDALSAEDLRRRAWQAFEPRYLARLAKLVEEFGEAKAKGLGSDDPAQAAAAAAAGRVAALLIEAGRQVPGRIDASSGRVESADPSDPEIDDLLDDLGELVLKRGGQVVVVPKERMPT